MDVVPFSDRQKGLPPPVIDSGLGLAAAGRSEILGYQRTAASCLQDCSHGGSIALFGISMLGPRNNDDPRNDRAGGSRP